MCGRYALALRPSQVRAYLEDDNMPVYDAPDDDGEGAPRQSYNFAPGYYGIVYRADTPDWGSGSRSHGASDGDADAEAEADAGTERVDEQGEARYKLQSMKWGLIPFWTKRNPDYGTLMRTINCRDDSLIEDKGMWTSMKRKKRCIIIAQGFYEWLKKGKDKIPHYTKRKDGRLMYLAGLWDCVQYEGSEEKIYTYTIITTSPNKQLDFLHDRMPAVLENGSEEINTWLDPKRTTWSKELQSLLKPFPGELEIYPVSKDVGKVGNNSESFVIPISSRQNKSNIANFFAKGATKGEIRPATGATSEVEVKDAGKIKTEKKLPDRIQPESREEPTDGEQDPTEADLSSPADTKYGIKREADDQMADQRQPKTLKLSPSPSKAPSPQKAKMRSATSNTTASPQKSTSNEKGTQKITSFFSK